MLINKTKLSFTASIFILVASLVASKLRAEELGSLQPPESAPGPRADLPPNWTSLGRELQNIGHNCRTSTCQALWTLYHVIYTMDDADRTPMSSAAFSTQAQALLARQLAPARVNRLMRRDLLSHPDHFAAVCARLQSMAAHYEQTGPDAASYDLVVRLINAAELIDHARPQHCLSDMIAQLPQTPELTALINDARDYCSGRQWHNAGCARIRQPN